MDRPLAALAAVAGAVVGLLLNAAGGLEPEARPLAPADAALILARNLFVFFLLLILYRVAGLRVVLPLWAFLNTTFNSYAAFSAPSRLHAAFTLSLAAAETAVPLALLTSRLPRAALAGLAAYTLLALAEVWGYGILAAAQPSSG